MKESTTKKAPQLHEILAVESDLAGQAQRIMAETVKTLGRNELFTGFTKTLKMDDELRSSEEDAAFEHREITTTVAARLKYNAAAITRLIDATLQKERTNQDAKADIIIDGTLIASDVPATALLNLEKRLKELRAVYNHIPTLQQGVEWEKAPDSGEGVFKTTHPEIRTRTEKVVTPVVLYEATQEHPAQIEKVSRDTVVGKFTTKVICGMVTPAEKSALIGRIDDLVGAVKKARQRANCTDVVNVKIGQKLFDFIHAK